MTENNDMHSVADQLGLHAGQFIQKVVKLSVELEKQRERAAADFAAIEELRAEVEELKIAGVEREDTEIDDRIRRYLRDND